jgi:predicted transcriptional regulator
MNGTGTDQVLIRDLPISEVMRRPVVSIDARCSAALALRELLACGIRHLVVIDSAGHGVGVLADRMLAACWAEWPGGLDRTEVGALVGSHPPFVAMDTTMAQAARVMHDCGLDAVAVLDSVGHPVGVLTTTDLMTLVAGQKPGPDQAT